MTHRTTFGAVLMPPLLMTLLAGCPGTTSGDAGVDGGGRDTGVATDGGGTDAREDGGISIDANLDAGPCAPPVTADSCRTGTDCMGGARCVPPGGFAGCGGDCVPPLATCASDPDCTDGSVCVEFVHPCSCGGPSSECRPRCTPTSCAADETCNNANGECQPTSCEAGYTCPAHTVCDPRPAADPHGCLRDRCTVDSDCDCGGGCVDLFCWESLGTCMLPPP